MYRLKLLSVALMISMLLGACSQGVPSAEPISVTFSSNLTPTPSRVSISYNGIHLGVDPALAGELSAQTLPGFVDPSGFAYNDVPKHIRLDFIDTYTTRSPFDRFAGSQFQWTPWLSHQNLEKPALQPQLFFFPTSAYRQISGLAAERIPALETLLAGESLTMVDELPVLPAFNSAQDLHAQMKVLAFKGGKGIRFVTRYSQEVIPFHNPALFYTFQGLSDDGEVYIAAFFPLYIDNLPDEVQVEDWETFNREYTSYLSKSTRDLETLTPAGFQPDLQMLDEAIQSSEVDSVIVLQALAELPATQIMPELMPSTPTTQNDTAAQTFRADPQVLARGEIHGVAYSPDGRWLAVAASSGAYLHAADTLSFERPLLEDQVVSWVAFSPDSRLLAVVTPKGVRLLEIPGGKDVMFIKETVQQAAFTPDGMELVGLTENSYPATVLLLDFQSGAQRELRFELDGAPHSMALSPDGRSLALGAQFGQVELFDLQTAARLAWLDTASNLPVTGLAFSPDGGTLAAALSSAEGKVRVWSVGERKRVIEEYRSGYYSPFAYLAFSAGGQRLLSGNGAIAVSWERPNPQPVGRLDGYAGRLTDQAISANGKWLAYATHEWIVGLHDLAGDTQNRVMSLPYYLPMSVNFSPSGEALAVGLYSYAPEGGPDQPRELVQVWDTASGEPLDTYPQASAAAFQPPVDSRVTEERLALADSQGVMRVVDRDSGSELCLPGCNCTPVGSPVETGACRLQLPHSLFTMKLDYSPGGEILSAWGVADAWGATSLLDTTSGDELAWFPGGSRPAFSAEGWVGLGVDEINSEHTVVTPTLVVYTPTDGQVLQRIRLPASGVAAFSPAGDLLAVGISTLGISNPVDYTQPEGNSNGLILYNTATWKQLAYLPVPFGITRLRFTPNGEKIITSGETGEILLWSLTPMR